MKSSGPPGATAGTALCLRAETAADEEFLADLYASTRWHELQPLPWTDQQKRSFLQMQFRAQRTHYRSTYAGARFDVVLFDGCRAGRLYVAPLPDELRIVDISLLPDFRGHRIGTRLVCGLIADADAAHLSLGLHVEQGNPALQWYGGFGFQAVRVTPPYVYMSRPVASD